MRKLSWVSVALVLTGDPALGQIGNDSNAILRSASELESLRTLLGQEEAWAVLHKLARRYPVWRLTTNSTWLSDCDGNEVGEEQGVQPRVFQHSFVFASRKGRSSRAYETTFRSCREEEGQRIQPLPGRFISWQPTRRGDPVVPGPVSLRIFRAAVNDDAVYSDLTGMLQNQSISLIRTRYVRGEAKGDDVYQVFLLEFGSRLGEPGEMRILLSYQVTYKRDSGEVVEILRLPGEE